MQESITYSMIRKMACQLLSVMCFMEKNGYIHADLKPENILLDKPDTRHKGDKVMAGDRVTR